MASDKSYDELDDRPATANKPRRRRLSFLGFCAVITGAAATAVAFRDRVPEFPYKSYLYTVPQYDYAVHPHHVAAAGAALAVLALLWRAVGGRTRAGWPVLGLLLCGMTAGAHRYQTSPRYPGTPEHWVEVNVVERVQRLLGDQGAEAGPVGAPGLAVAGRRPGPATHSGLDVFR